MVHLRIVRGSYGASNMWRISPWKPCIYLRTWWVSLMFSSHVSHHFWVASRTGTQNPYSRGVESCSTTYLTAGKNSEMVDLSIAMFCQRVLVLCGNSISFVLWKEQMRMGMGTRPTWWFIPCSSYFVYSLHGLSRDSPLTTAVMTYSLQWDWLDVIS